MFLRSGTTIQIWKNSPAARPNHSPLKNKKRHPSTIKKPSTANPRLAASLRGSCPEASRDPGVFHACKYGNTISSRILIFLLPALVSGNPLLPDEVAEDSELSLISDLLVVSKCVIDSL